MNRSRPIRTTVAGSARTVTSVVVRNHQRFHPIDTRLVRHVVRTLLTDLLDQSCFDISIQFVGMTEIIRLNETFLRHAGPTDVIAFDYREEPGLDSIYGEVFVCVPVAIQQAPRFRTSREHELVRYVVHGILHLCGYDDSDPASKLKMKREEGKALQQLASRFYLGKITGHRRAGKKAANG